MPEDKIHQHRRQPLQKKFEYLVKMCLGIVCYFSECIEM